MSLSETTAPVLEIVYWTLGGFFTGAFFGWQLGVANEIRSTTKHVMNHIEEVERILKDLKPWDGKERRKVPSDRGSVSLSTLFVGCLIVMAVISSALGIFVAAQTQAQTRCFAMVNEQFARTIEVRNNEAGELSRQASEIDRFALDTLVGKVVSGLEARATHGEELDILPALNEYREKRRESEVLRSEAKQALINNPYPSAEICK